MSVLPLLWRNMKWRYHNAFTIVMTILQPMLWLVLYSAVAGQTMKGAGISNYTAFILPGLVVLVSFSACSSGGIMNYLMKAEGSFYRILIAPVSRTSIITAQILEAVCCTFLEVGILFGAGLFFSVRIASGFVGMLLIVLIVFLTAFFMSGLTYAISLRLPNEVIYETVMNAVVLPAFFLSTALFPADTLTGPLKTIVNFNPLTHVINILRTLLLQGEVHSHNLLWVICLLVVLCAISFCAALRGLNQEMSL